MRLNTVLHLFIVATLATSIQSSYAQTSDNILPFLTEQTTRFLNLKPNEGSKILPLKQSLSLAPLVPDSIPKSKLLSAWSIPTISQSSYVEFTQTSVAEQVVNYFEDESKFELGYVKLSASETESLNKALGVLFTDPSQRKDPTQLYSRYRTWQSEHEELVTAIQNEPNAAKKIALNQKLTLLDQDYRLTGEKERVETAMEIVSKYTSEATQFNPQLASIRKAADPIAMQRQYIAALNSVTSTAAWVRISIDINAKFKATLSSKDGIIKDYETSVSTISYQALVVPVLHPALSADVCGNRAWRRKDRTVLGDPEGAVTGRAVPYFVSNIIVIKDIDMKLDTNLDETSNFLNDSVIASNGQVGNLPMRYGEQGAAFVLPGHVYMPAPQIIGSVVSVTPKIPNPSSNLEWK